MPEIVEKSSPCRSGDASYSSLRQASVPESERGSSVVAMRSHCRRAWFPEDLGPAVRGAREDEQEVGEPVQVHGNERVYPLDRKCPALRAPADRAHEEQARRELASAGEDEAFQRLEPRVRLVALGLQPVDRILSDAEPAVVLDERHRQVGAEVEELVLDVLERSARFRD